jgi:hypothetical protein
MMRSPFHASGAVSLSDQERLFLLPHALQLCLAGVLIGRRVAQRLFFPKILTRRGFSTVESRDQSFLGGTSWPQVCRRSPPLSQTHVSRGNRTRVRTPNFWGMKPCSTSYMCIDESPTLHPFGVQSHKLSPICPMGTDVWKSDEGKRKLPTGVCQGFCFLALNI